MAQLYSPLNFTSSIPMAKIKSKRSFVLFTIVITAMVIGLSSLITLSYFSGDISIQNVFKLASSPSSTDAMDEVVEEPNEIIFQGIQKAEWCQGKKKYL